MCSFRIIVLFIVTIFLIPNPYRIQSLGADEINEIFNDENSEEESSDPWYLSFYRGQFSDTNLGHILLNAQTRYKPSFVNVMSVARPLKYDVFGMETEAEGQIAYHEGIMKHLEYNGVFVLRSPEFSNSFPMRFGLGEGLSLATRNPELENKRKSISSPNTESEYSKNFLNYLMFELDYALPALDYAPRAFLRIHHRSGIYGIFCPPTCGSNFIAYGMKFTY